MSQLSEISMLYPSELPQKADVVFEEHAEVGDVVLQHRQPVQSGPEGEPGEVCRVDAAVAQHLRMDHAGTQDLQPAGLAAPASGAVAETTGDRGADARLGKGQMVADDPD